VYVVSESGTKWAFEVTDTLETTYIDKGYLVEIKHAGYKPESFSVQTKTDVYLGEIVLSAKV